jgi:hypothetical protein
VDLPLLARLSRAYPHIDTYGEAQPDPSLGLHYRGYAASSVLRDYQFGLITCIDDPLRRDGISAKHLSYLAAGLPVLVPACGPQHRTCLAARSSDEAFAAAQRLTRDTMLRPPESVLALGTGSRAPSA